MPLIKMETLNTAFLLFSSGDSEYKRKIPPNPFVSRFTVPYPEMFDQNFALAAPVTHHQIKFLAAMESLVDLLYTLDL